MSRRFYVRHTSCLAISGWTTGEGSLAWSPKGQTKGMANNLHVWWSQAQWPVSERWESRQTHRHNRPRIKDIKNPRLTLNLADHDPRIRSQLPRDHYDRINRGILNSERVKTHFYHQTLWQTNRVIKRNYYFLQIPRGTTDSNRLLNFVHRFQPTWRCTWRSHHKN